MTHSFCRADLIKMLTSATCHHPFIVAIDGCGGAGKSSFAEWLADELKMALAAAPAREQNLTFEQSGDSDSGSFAVISDGLPVDVQIIKMDDFYKPSRERLPQREADALIGSDYDWQRLRTQVLQPLIHGQTVSYQRYDWDSDMLAEWHDVNLNSVVIIEGCYSLRHELTFFYNLTCWVYCSREQRLERGIARDGETKREIWEKYWMPAEDRYVELEEPHRRANILIDGSGATDCISARCNLDALFATRDH
jgi:uridine kinase